MFPRQSAFRCSRLSIFHEVTTDGIFFDLLHVFLPSSISTTRSSRVFVSSEYPMDWSVGTLQYFDEIHFRHYSPKFVQGESSAPVLWLRYHPVLPKDPQYFHLFRLWAIVSRLPAVPPQLLENIFFLCTSTWIRATVSTRTATRLSRSRSIFDFLAVVTITVHGYLNFTMSWFCSCILLSLFYFGIWFLKRVSISLSTTLLDFKLGQHLRSYKSVTFYIGRPL